MRGLGVWWNRVVSGMLYVSVGAAGSILVEVDATIGELAECSLLLELYDHMSVCILCAARDCPFLAPIEKVTGRCCASRKDQGIILPAASSAL